MGNLLNNGFHLGEVINFLALSKLVEKEFVFKMHQGLSSGNSLSEILDSLSCSKNVVTQLALVDRKSTRLNSSHIQKSRMPSSA